MALKVGEYSIALDCGEPSANVNFVSHAHSDHISGIRKNRKVIASQVTKEFIQCRNGRKQIELIENPKNIEMLNAGHILGSKQLYATSEELGASVIYSGDYQLQRSLVAEPIETKSADILIIDSTYPDKKVSFGDRNEVMSDIQNYIRERLKEGIVLFGSYTLGKSQELIKIANEAGFCPVVDEKISMINKIYEKHGVGLDYLSMHKDESELESMLNDNFLGITSVSKLQELAYRLSSVYRKKVFTAEATGFAKVLDLGVDAQFPLSDHADFKQATEYIDMCNPKIVYTYGNRMSSELFARNLSDDGYNASVYGELSILQTR